MQLSITWLKKKVSVQIDSSSNMARKVVIAIQLICVMELSEEGPTTVPAPHPNLRRKNKSIAFNNNKALLFGGVLCLY